MAHLKEIKIPPRSPRKVGVVESDARDKTRKVAIYYAVPHPKYGKLIRSRTTLQVHDEENVSKVGDRVEIGECRRISKTKSWIVLRVLGSRAGSPPSFPEALPKTTEVAES